MSSLTTAKPYASGSGSSHEEAFVGCLQCDRAGHKLSDPALCRANTVRFLIGTGKAKKPRQFIGDVEPANSITVGDVLLRWEFFWFVQSADEEPDDDVTIPLGFVRNWRAAISTERSADARRGGKDASLSLGELYILFGIGRIDSNGCAGGLSA